MPDARVTDKMVRADGLNEDLQKAETLWKESKQLTKKIKEANPDSAEAAREGCRE